jgi:anti-sigma-K factor RskA
MDHNQIYELLPAFALDCLDDEDSSVVSEHLASCDKCYARLSAYQRTVDLLSFGAPRVNPPDALKKKLMNKIQPKILMNNKIKRPAKRQKWGAFWHKFSPVWAIASLAIISALAVSNLVQLQTTKKLNGEEVTQEMLILKMKGTAKAPKADGTLVIGHNRLRGVLVASDLPVPDRDYQYQLWLIENGKRTNGGVFFVTANGYAVVEVISPVSLLKFQSFGVTLEPAGGSPSPTGHQVMVGYL